MKDIDFFELGIGLALVILTLVPLFTVVCGITEKDNYIKQLEQNNFEQIEEKEYYITRTQELENIIKDSGIVVDDCECE